MADIKTSLRELSTALMLGIKIKHLSININDLYNPQIFIKTLTKVIDNDINKNINIINLKEFNSNLKQIIANGFKLANAIYNCTEFKFNEGDSII